MTINSPRALIAHIGPDPALPDPFTKALVAQKAIQHRDRRVVCVQQIAAHDVRLDPFDHLFETTVARCIAKGLVSGQRFAADASLIEADANKQNSTPKEDWNTGAITVADAPRAVREYLDVLYPSADAALTEGIRG